MSFTTFSQGMQLFRNGMQPKNFQRSISKLSTTSLSRKRSEQKDYVNGDMFFNLNPNQRFSSQRNYLLPSVSATGNGGKNGNSNNGYTFNAMLGAISLTSMFSMILANQYADRVSYEHHVIKMAKRVEGDLLKRGLYVLGWHGVFQDQGLGVEKNGSVPFAQDIRSAGCWLNVKREKSHSQSSMILCPVVSTIPYSQQVKLVEVGDVNVLSTGYLSKETPNIFDTKRGLYVTKEALNSGQIKVLIPEKQNIVIDNASDTCNRIDDSLTWTPPPSWMRDVFLRHYPFG